MIDLQMVGLLVVAVGAGIETAAGVSSSIDGNRGLAVLAFGFAAVFWMLALGLLADTIINAINTIGSVRP